MGVNFYGPFYTMRAVIPHFLTKSGEESSMPGESFSFYKIPKGSIVNVCSVAGLRGGANGASYTAAKHALLGLTRQTAVSYSLDGIRCNAVIPGPVNTNIMGNSEGLTLHPEGGPALAATRKPLLGYAEPLDIAKAIVFVASSISTNGSEIQVDHGYLVR